MVGSITVIDRRQGIPKYSAGRPQPIIENIDQAPWKPDRGMTIGEYTNYLRLQYVSYKSPVGVELRKLAELLKDGWSVLLVDTVDYEESLGQSIKYALEQLIKRG